MSYRDTAHDFAAAERGDSAAADRLPLSEWAATRRDTATPKTIAANHAVHVHGDADELRNALRSYAMGTADERCSASDRLATAATALLAAIGEAGA